MFRSGPFDDSIRDMEVCIADYLRIYGVVSLSIYKIIFVLIGPFDAEMSAVDAA